MDSPKLGPWSCCSVLLGEGFRMLLKVPGQAEDSSAGRGEQHTCAPPLRRQMGCEVESHFWLHRAFEVSLS